MTETESAPSTGPVEDAPVAGAPRLFEFDDLRPRRPASKWDRPAAPRDWRWYVGTAGKVLIAVGALMFGFVAYQLWGTGIETARAQRALENEFEELLAATPPPEVPVAEVPATTDAPRAVEGTLEAPLPPELQQIPAVDNGDALARIEIPAIGVDDIVVAGVEPADLKTGPGHYPDTPLPGQLGNAAIAGHRTTYGQPFHDVDDLQPGDEIVVTTLTGRFVYLVTGRQIVSPSDSQVVATTDWSSATLTLTSCHPKWSASERIIISSELDLARSGPVGEPTVGYGRDVVAAPDPASDREAGETSDATATGGATTGDATATGGATTGDATDDEPADGASTGDATGDGQAGDEPAADASTGGGEDVRTVSDQVADAFSDGWFSDPGAYPHVAGWGLLLTAIAVGSWLLSRRFRHDLVGALVGIVPFVVALYFFFQNVNRMLPPNL